MYKMFTTLIDILRYRAKYQGDQKAYTFLKDGDKDEISYTYETLDIRARSIAAWLQTKVKSGERVMLFYHQGLDFISAFYGCLYAGVIAVPGYPPEGQHRRTTRLQAIVKDAGAKIALTTIDVLENMDIQNRKALVGLEMQWFPTDTLSDIWAKDWNEPDIDRDTVTYLQYSSGSTGDPKGIMVSHGNMLDNSAIICDRLQHTKDDVSVSWLPIFHDLGLIGCVVQPMYVGFHAVSLSPYQYVVNPYLWLKAIDRFRGTTTCCPNFGFDLCVRKTSPVQRASLDLSSWRVAVNCAEPVRYQTLEKFTEVFSPYGFRAEAHYPMYGMAETTLFITGASWDQKPGYCSVSIPDLNKGHVHVSDDQNARMMVSCGSTGTGLTIKIVDPKTWKLCDPNIVGEVWVKGSSVAHGYWNRPEQSKEDFEAYIGGDGPYLRTGDLGFFIDEELFLAGRYKDLVIIRGKNLYPQDLELTVESCSSFCRPGCGAAFSIDDGEEKLIIVQELRQDAFQLVDIPQLARQIQQALAEEHGVKCHELIFIEENSVQKTSSGKIQRRACKKAYAEDQLHVVYRLIDNEPLASTEEELFQWQEWSLLTPTRQRTVLEDHVVSHLGLHGVEKDWMKREISFFGFDSIRILQFKFSIEEYWGVELPKVGILLGWTWGQFFVCVHAQLLEPPTDIKKLDQPSSAKDSAIPLNRGQEAIWYIQETFPNNSAYHIPIALRFAKECNKDLLYQSFRYLVERYPILLSCIQQRKDGKLEFILPSDIQLNWEEKDAIVDFTSQLIEDAYQPFYLNQTPLLQIKLYQHVDQSFTCLICFHHIVCDLWSLDMFLSELRFCYESLENGKKPYFKPIKPVCIEEKEPKPINLAYWKEKLAGELPVLDLPQKQTRGSSQSFKGEQVASILPKEAVLTLRELASTNGATLYQVLLAVYQMVLSRHSGQTDIIIGSPTVARPTIALSKQMNYMVNPMVIRGDLSGSPTFTQLLQQTRQNVQEATEYDISFIDLVENLAIKRDPSIPSIFQAMLAFEQTSFIPEISAMSLGLGEITIPWGKSETTSVAIPDITSQFDVTLKIAENNGDLALHWQYDSYLFEKNMIQQLADSYVMLLEQIGNNPNQSIHSYTYMSEEMQSTILQFGDGGKSVNPEVTLSQAWQEQVAKSPDKVAVIDGLDRITYQQMHEDVNQFAQLLIEKGIGNGQIVGIALHRKYSLMVAIMAVLQTGAAYLGLDPSYPKERLQYMVEDANATLLLIDQEMESKLSDLQVVKLTVKREMWSNYSTTSVQTVQELHQLAYLIYTSGSTGKPKGVAVEQRQVMTFVQWAKDVFTEKELEGVLFGTSVCFDLSIFEIFVPLLSGGKVILAENALSLPVLPAANEVTLINTVPSAAKGLLSLGFPSSVLTVNLAGEPLPRQLVDDLYQIQSVKRVYNLYGPSECTTYSTYALMNREDCQSPFIGKPIRNTKIFILDHHQQMVPMGVTGELYIGGNGVAREYFGQPDKTAEKFMDHPHYGRLYRTGDLVRFSKDGELIYLGRTDFQVKVRGFRIELGEIETALCEHSTVKEAALIADEQQLIAYIVQQVDSIVDTEVLHSYLEEKLPQYMIPNQIIVLSSFPLTLNGKIDRKALPKPAEHENLCGMVQPANDQEAKLLAIWKRVLKKDQIGVTDRFFELGGDSILSLQVIAEAKQLGFKINPKHFFTHPTIEKMAHITSDDSKLHIDQSVVTGDVLLTPIQEWFFYQKIPNHNNWNQSMILTLDKRVEPLLLQQVLQKLVDHHDALRLRFYLKQVQWTSSNAESEHNVLLEVVNEADSSIEYLHQVTEQQLNIRKGPIIAATFVSRDQQDPVLIIAIHHLAMDGVSWRILIDDIKRLYQQLENGVPLLLNAKTTSYQQWARYIQQESLDTQKMEQEKKHWLGIVKPMIERFPVDYKNGVNTDTQTEEYIQIFTREETYALLNQSSKMKINELLLVALWKGYQKWSGNKALRLDLEGHGRDHENEQIDVSRTIGWFTSIYPVLLQGDSNDNRISIIREQLQRRSDGGRGYGILRYMNKDPELMAADSSPILFNYLGQFDQMIEEKTGLIKKLSFYGPRKYQEAVRPYLLEINSYIQDGKLVLSWGYSKGLYRASTISTFAKYFAEACLTMKQGKTKIKNKVREADLSRIFSKIKERKGR
ncbi:non-ribosomal peptide synthetase [Shimazuella kribbensis]|uniref:non-ribosomal peptide synthetase n=1 Tax=Shimazuella kribbensis TaxID=139808 RepID=UPI000424A085|nr:non-ribosomal peptide synthetase [Shimazuella kribbensis]